MEERSACCFCCLLLLFVAEGSHSHGQSSKLPEHHFDVGDDSAFNGLNASCISGCLCDWLMGNLVGIACTDNHERICLENEVASKPKTFWNHLKSVHVEGKRSYSCISKSAFYYGFLSMEELVVVSSSDEWDNEGFFNLEDITYLTSLRNLSLIRLGMSDSTALSTLSGLKNLLYLDLSGNAYQEFNAAILFQWSGTLKKFTLSHCENLKMVVFHKNQYVDIPENGNMSALDSVILSSNPRLQTVCPWFIRSAPNVHVLDMSLNPTLEIIPSYFYSSSMDSFSLETSSFFCDCRISSVPPSPAGTNGAETNLLHQPCIDPKTKATVSSLVEYVNESTNCRSENNEVDVTETKMTSFANDRVMLDCGRSSKHNVDFISWITPLNEIKVSMPDDGTSGEDSNRCWGRDHLFKEACVPGDEHLILSRIVYSSGGDNHSVVYGNGSLVIWDFGWRDRGTYNCFTWSRTPSLNKSAAVSGDSFKVVTNSSFTVGLDVDYRKNHYSLSLIYGFATAVGFLLVTLLAKMVYFLLNNYGCCLFCCCCKEQLPPKAKKLKYALDSIEAYRMQQQERLRDNYHQQSDWIRQNCAVQMERVRDNYNVQVQNLRDIRQYGSSHLTAVRNQYYDQMQRIRDYSTGQLEKVNENYIFQRQKLRKFSAQNYLKMRQTGKYTRRTMNKVMETLPALYLDLTACRQGLGQRQASLEWGKEDMEFETVGTDATTVNASITAWSFRGLKRSKDLSMDSKEKRKLVEKWRGGSVDSFPARRHGEKSYAPPLQSLSDRAGFGFYDPYEALYHNLPTMEQNDNVDHSKEKFPYISFGSKSLPKTRGRSFSIQFLPANWFNGNQDQAKTSVAEVHRAVIEHRPLGGNGCLDNHGDNDCSPGGDSHAELKNVSEAALLVGGDPYESQCAANENADQESPSPSATVVFPNGMEDSSVNRFLPKGQPSESALRPASFCDQQRESYKPNKMPGTLIRDISNSDGKLVPISCGDTKRKSF